MHKGAEITLSVVTVNFNGLTDTLEMLASLYAHVSDVEFEAIVVDNGSHTDESAPIREAFPQAIVIRSEENLGFAGGNNLGIAKALGRYIFLLNNDTVITESNISKLIKRMDTNPSIGAISPKIRFHFDEQTIQFAGYTPLSRITLRNRLIGYDEPDLGQYDTPRPTPYAHGAAMMVRSEAISRVGLMPELYFLYYEELDWSERITESGYSIEYDPSMTVFHKESRSTGMGSPFREYYLTRNRLIYACRNRSGAERIAALAYQLLLVNPAKLIRELLTNRSQYAKARYRGVRDFFTHKTH